jgi:excinuclease ABC subunit A
VEPWATSLTKGEGWVVSLVRAVSDDLGVPLVVPWKSLTARQRSLVLYGSGAKRVRVQWGNDSDESAGYFNVRFEGILNSLMRRYQQTSSEQMKARYERYLSESPCPACEGARLRPESRAVIVGERTLVDVASMTISEASKHFHALDLKGARRAVAEELLKEIHARLGFLLNVGLEYLTLSRTATTLSGGEAQRIRLASQLGSELSGVMYVLDEPSIGLHARDNTRLITTLQRLRDLGNTVIVVEHDREAIETADHVCDFGPGAGRKGGELIFSGSPEELADAPRSLTGAFLSGRERIDPPAERRTPIGWITINGCAENNLREIDVRFPLGVLCAVTGVSGAGKSSLIGETLYPALRRRLYDAYDRVGKNSGVEGIEQIDKVINIDQSPIGRTPRSNPATYTKAFDLIRDLYAQSPEAKAYGYKPGRFSFNVKGGRCEACEGDGQKRVEMHFLPDVFVPCEVCRGKRYNEGTLRVKFKNKNIAELLDTTVEEASSVFAHHPPLAHILGTLLEVGLGYIAIGQPAPTLSGGEAQRVKLSRELARRQTGRTLYILDEPTTGLHFDDVRKLLQVLQRLVDAGNTVLVIEHNLDVIRCADYLIDLGPEGGAAGGSLVAEGTPEEVAAVVASYTGQALRPLLSARRPRRIAQRA